MSRVVAAYVFRSLSVALGYDFRDTLADGFGQLPKLDRVQILWKIFGTKYFEIIDYVRKIIAVHNTVYLRYIITCAHAFVPGEFIIIGAACSDQVYEICIGKIGD
jgi:hypothetical protein